MTPQTHPKADDTMLPVGRQLTPDDLPLLRIGDVLMHTGRWSGPYTLEEAKAAAEADWQKRFSAARTAAKEPAQAKGGV